MKSEHLWPFRNKKNLNQTNQCVDISLNINLDYFISHLFFFQTWIQTSTSSVSVVSRRTALTFDPGPVLFLRLPALLWVWERLLLLFPPVCRNLNWAPFPHILARLLKPFMLHLNARKHPTRSRILTDPRHRFAPALPCDRPVCVCFLFFFLAPQSLTWARLGLDAQYLGKSAARTDKRRLCGVGGIVWASSFNHSVWLVSDLSLCRCSVCFIPLEGIGLKELKTGWSLGSFFFFFFFF